MDSGELPLFIYGSLLDAALRAKVIGHLTWVTPATLRGYERDKRRYWFIRSRDAASVEGAVLMSLTADDLQALDRYEEVPRLYTRQRVRVRLADGSERECQVYLPTGWERN